jgi:hypothetical protein
MAQLSKGPRLKTVPRTGFPGADRARLCNLSSNYPFEMLAVPQAQVSHIHASSGTTGQPTVVGYTANDIRTWSSVMARSIRASGGRPIFNAC